MGVVTKVEVQAKHKDRVNLYIDDEFFCGLNIETAVMHGIKKGKYFDNDDLAEMIKDSEKKTAFDKALTYLSKTPKTKKQMFDYLTKKGYESDISDYVLERLVEYKYVDDNSYAISYIECMKKKYGKTKLKYDLSCRGIEKSIIDEAIENTSFDSNDLRKIADRYLKGNYSYENLIKLNRYLASKGFCYDEIHAIINEISEEGRK